VDAVDAVTAWAVGEGGVILKTSDGGATWTPQVSGTGAALFGVSAIDSSTAWAVGAGGVIVATSDGGATWRALNSRVRADLYGVSAVSASTCWAVGSGGTILKTSDGGATWTPQGAVVVGAAAAARSAANAGAEVDGARGTDAMSGDGAATDTDTGTAVARPGGGDDTRTGADVGTGDILAADPATGGDGPHGNDRTVQGAGVEASVAAVTGATLRAVYAANPFTAWAVGEGGVAFKTTDGGLTWVSVGGAASSLYGVTGVGASALAVGDNRTTRALP